MGYDLLALELDDLYSQEYGELVGLMIAEATTVMGDAEVARRLRATDVDDELEQCLKETSGNWQVRRSPYACTAKVFARLIHDKEPKFVNAMRNHALRFCCERSVPVPPIGWGMESRS